MDGLYKRGKSPFYYALLKDPRMDGGYRRLSTGKSTEREARSVAEKLQQEIDTQIAQIGGLRWLDACEDFIHRADLKRSTKEGYVSLVSVVLNSCLGDLNLRELDHGMVKRFVNERRRTKIKVPNRPGEYTDKYTSDATIRRYLSFISGVIKWSIDQDLEGAPNENIMKTFDRSGLKESKPMDRHLRPEQFLSILNSLTSEQDKRMLIVLVGTGMRLSEFLDLKWSEVDLKHRVIEFGNLDPSRTKSRRARRIPILPPVAEALTAQCVVSSSVDRGYVFPSPVGGGRRYRLSSLLNRVRKNSGIENFRIHDLRHTFASWALQQGVDPFAISLVLGHSDVKTTARYARHISDSALAQFQDVTLM